MPKFPLVAPYGSWKSPITAELIVADTVGLAGVLLDGDDVYWSELRPAERGRNAVVRRRDGITEDLLPQPYSARTRVNEYGGGALAVSGGVVYFVNDADQRIHRHEPGELPQPITPVDARRYADLVVDPVRHRVIAVCEDHDGTSEPAQSIVSIDVDGRTPPRTLARGRDFYAAPRLDPAGRHLAFLAWDHPNMPWDGTDLFLAELDTAGDLKDARRVAGGREEAVFQPALAPDGTLHFVSDRTGWWNLYRYCVGSTEALLPLTAEFGAPLWVFGLSTFAFISARRIVCAFNEGGHWRLGVLDAPSRSWRTLSPPYSDIGYVHANERRAVFIGAGPATLAEVAELDFATEQFRVIRRSAVVPIDAKYLSPPQPIEFDTSGGERAHAFFYAPRNRDFAPPREERPPLLVVTHGGPTAAASSALNLKVQYWASRGFAVLDVNYRGSTGFGRAYRRRLDGGWGVIDVEDCVHGVRHLIARGAVDGTRVAIRGSSAGGYTALCALVFHRVFRAGAVYYGISDLEALARDTHKFESRYLERLIGPGPAARERSPIHHAERITCPVIFFQGLEDPVVPPDQTERLVQALRARRIPVAYLPFPGEQHGFRMASNVKRALEAELRFYGRVFGFLTDVDDSAPDPLA